MRPLPTPRTPRLLILAAAGYGKSTLLEAERPLDGAVCTAADALAHGLPDRAWIGLDRVDELDLAGQRELAGRLADLPARTVTCLASRTPWQPVLRDRLRGQYFERGPSDLALDTFTIARLLADEYAVLDPDAATRVFTVTAGWPTLVHFAGDVLARRSDVDVLSALAEPGSTSAAWVRAHVLADWPADVRTVLAHLAAVGPITDGVFRRAAEVLHLRPDPVLGHLRRQGLLVPADRPAAAGAGDLVPVIARVLMGSAPAGAEPVPADLARAVAQVYERESLPLPAARAYRQAAAFDHVERLLADRGAEMVRGGEARGVVEVATALPGAPSRALRRSHADALRRLGDGAAARRVLAPLVSSDGVAPDSDIAALLASAYYSEGDLEAALRVLDHIGPDDVGNDRAGVEWRACRVQVLVMLGRRAEAEPLAVEALRLAEALGDPLAVAAAGLAVARTSAGARKEAYLEAAHRAAVAAGDVVTAALVRVNQSYLLLASARYAEAAAVAREALRLSSSCPTGRLSAALHNLGEALTQTGDFDEARWVLQRAVVHSRQLGPGRTALGLYGLGEIHRQLGQEERARAAYEEAIGLARVSGERQVLVPALCGLARLRTSFLAGTAAASAAEAEVLATPAVAPLAVIARGWVALSSGDHEAAADHARRAAELATAESALDLLAEALELRGVAVEDPYERQCALSRALDIWVDGGARPRAARIELFLGRSVGADAARRSAGRDAARLLQRLGMVDLLGQPVTDDARTTQVTIQVLGSLTARVAGKPVPLQAWRSPQARTLVRILASRRGRPVGREHLCEMLWPGDDPARTGHRLSVLLATVRGVLDPSKQWPPDHVIAADHAGLRLDLSHVSVDADDILRDSRAGVELMDAGEEERAREIFADIDARYVGDAFEDVSGEEWADAFRQETQRAWQRSVRRLATLRRREGRIEEAHRLLLRLLTVDPYDEQVHAAVVRMLARSGRHGEARLAFRRWHEAMAEIDAPLPHPAVLEVSGARTRGRGPRHLTDGPSSRPEPAPRAAL